MQADQPRPVTLEPARSASPSLIPAVQQQRVHRVPFKEVRVGAQPVVRFVMETTCCMSSSDAHD